MTYEALARKYRPRTFDEVVGQEPIVRTLINAIRESRIHHAYVFSGVRGVGKTSVARIFAKALNCETGPTATPCLRCDPCLEIAAGRNLDVIEMDAASRTGVDDVRDLIDTTRYAPARDRYKIFIIDEFHMLSKPAFNALLKTLEEPPPRVIFLMATTELHKVLPTVVSRTLQFDFRKVSLAEITGQLEKIAVSEGVDAPRICLEMLARAADGSVRDAESLLDQAIAFCGVTLVEEDIRTLLGLVPEETVEDFLTASADRDAGGMIRMISMALAEGRDLRVFHAGLLEGVRRLLLVKTLDRPSEILGLAPEDEERLGALAGRFRTEELLRLFSILAGLEAPLKYSDQPRYLFEAAAIKMASIADLAPIEDLISRFEGGAAGGGLPSPPAGRGSSPAGREGGSPRGVGGCPPTAPPGATERSGPVPKPPPGRRKSEPASERSPVAAVADSDQTGTEKTSFEGETRSSEAVAIATRADEIPFAEPSDAPEERGDSEEPSDQGSLAAIDRLEAEPPESGQAPEGAAADDLQGRREERFLSRLRETKETLFILIEDTARIAFEGDVLAVLFEDSQVFARKSVEQPSNLAILRDAARASEGRPIRVDVRRAGASLSASSSAPRGLEPGAGARAASTSGGLVAAELDPPSALLSHEDSAAVGEDAKAGRSGLGPRFDAQNEPARTEDASSGSVRVPSMPSPDASRAEGRPGGARYQRLHALALEDPAVKRFVERFGGRIVEIKEAP